MPDGGYYAIKGFEFQIDKTILELFKSDGIDPVCLEQIQDINTNNLVMQVKYKETQEYSPAKIKEPIIQLIKEYQKFPTKKYYLYCYFKDIQEVGKKLKNTELDRILGNKKDDFPKALKRKFLGSFELHFSKSFQDQFIQAVEIIKTNGGCSNFDEALIYYGSIANHLRKIVVNNLVVKNRTCTKSEILAIITGNRKTVFDSAYRIYKGKQQYIAEIKKRHFTYRNIDNWERFLIIELSGSENIASIKSTTLKIKNKFYKKLTKKIKSGAPYIHFRNIANGKLKRLKTDLLAEGHIIKDGYDFMDADFRVKTLKIKSTVGNDISLKILNSENNLHQMLECDLECTKKIYQFFTTKPLDVATNIDMVSVEIANLSELQQILS